MPGLDKRGPMGYGPKTGRGLGLCNNTSDMRNTGAGFARGAGMGRRAGFMAGGGGRQRNRCYSNRGYWGPAGVENNDELSSMRDQIQSLNRELESLKAKISGKTDVDEG